MYYIFEDRKISDTSTIFRYAYPEKISEKFIYSDGVGGIQRRIEELVSKVSKPDFAIFIDTVPGNSTVLAKQLELYDIIREMEKSGCGRGIVIPIVCSEYYIIKALVKIGMLPNNNDIDICINKGVYIESDLIKEHYQKLGNPQMDNRIINADYTYFEGYCKMILNNYGFRKCTKPVSKLSTAKGLYYKRNCNETECEYYNHIGRKGISRCLDKILEEKACEIIEEYPVFPAESFLEKDSVIADYDKVVLKHRELVDEFNQWDEQYLREKNERLRCGIKLSYLK